MSVHAVVLIGCEIDSITEAAEALDADISTIAAAPSVMPLELPAVTLPPSRNTGFSPARPSSVV